MNNNAIDPLCSYEMSKLFKEKGCDVMCNYYFDSKEFIHRSYCRNSFHNSIERTAVPTHKVAIMWIRKNFGLNISSHCDISDNNYYTYSITRVEPLPFWRIVYNVGRFESPEKAEEEALLYALKNLL